MKNNLLFLFFILIASCSPANKAKKLILQGSILQSDFHKTIDYKKYQEWIIVEVKLNGKDKTYRFLFDTGAVTVVGEALAKELSLPNIVERPVGSSTSVKKSTAFTQIENMNIAGVDFQNIGAVILDFYTSPELSCLGMNIDGIIGANMMKHAVWQVDYENQQIHFTNDWEKLTYGENTYEIPFTYSRQRSPYVELTFNGETFKAEFDTGKGGGVGLPYGKVKKVIDQFDDNEIMKGFGVSAIGVFGGEQDTVYKIAAKDIGMGTYTQDTLLIDTGRRTKALIGNRFLKNFKVTFDWKMDLITLEPYSKIEKPLTEFETFGFGPTLKDEQLALAFIWEHSPIFENDIPLGSKILKINDEDVSKTILEDFCKSKDDGFFPKDAGQVNLTIELPDGTVRNIQLDKKRML